METYKKRWAERENDEDPVEFYRDNYNGYSRSKLSIEDFALYRLLSRRGLLDSTIPADEKAVNIGRKSRINSSRFGKNPAAYYRRHYKGLTRGALEKLDSSLYERLRVEGLLHIVPKMSKDEIKKRSRFGRHPLAYYRRNYRGVTRYKLSCLDPSLYNRLRREKLLDNVPTVRTFQDFGDDPLGYYHEHHNGLTRGQLNRDNPGLYNRLRNDGVLSEVPLKHKPDYLTDPLGYYHKNYDGLTRGQLKKVDRSLYHKLWREGLLEDIPLMQR